MCSTHYYDVNIFFEDEDQYERGKAQLLREYRQTKRIKRLNKTQKVITLTRCLSVGSIRYRLTKMDLLYKEAHLAKKEN